MMIKNNFPTIQVQLKCTGYTSKSFSIEARNLNIEELYYYLVEAAKDKYKQKNSIKEE